VIGGADNQPRQHRQCALHYRIARRFVIAGEEERVEMI
jgi:hypothetical protein